MLKVAVENITNWVFVTGAPRGGTTFVGKVLSLPLEVDYIHEPFNTGCGMEGMERRFRYVRPALDTEAMRRYHERVEPLFSYDFYLKTPYYPDESPLRRAMKTVVGSRGPFYLRLAKLNPFHKAAVVKDPTGCFLTEYLHERFEVRPVIVVRHPVSLIASLNRVAWEPSLHWFRDQPALAEDYFADEPNFLERTWPSAAEEAAAHWRILYKVLLEQAERYPEWPLVTHEALSEDPIGEFGRLYGQLDLPWSESVAKKISKLTGANNSVRPKNGRVQDLKRKSEDIFEHRRDSVPVEERRAIFEITKDVALQVYDRDTFAID